MQPRWIGVLLSLATIALSGVAHADGYGALAVGINGDQIGTGAALNFSTQASADANAIKDCETQTSNCKVVGQFAGGGCGYVAIAIAHGTCWGSGATSTEATSQCQAHGCGACKPPIGGCLKAP
jgi:Domain of unknown function (DUF4189)